jgi:hypothetical protein
MDVARIYVIECWIGSKWKLDPCRANREAYTSPRDCQRVIDLFVRQGSPRKYRVGEYSRTLKGAQ